MSLAGFESIPSNLLFRDQGRCGVGMTSRKWSPGAIGPLLSGVSLLLANPHLDNTCHLVDFFCCDSVCNDIMENIDYSNSSSFNASISWFVPIQREVRPEPRPSHRKVTPEPFSVFASVIFLCLQAHEPKSLKCARSVCLLHFDGKWGQI